MGFKKTPRVLIHAEDVEAIKAFPKTTSDISARGVSQTHQ